MRMTSMAAWMAAVAVGGCMNGSGTPLAPETFTVPVHVTSGGTLSVHGAGASRNMRTHLSGDEEVPARDTRAQGQAIFQVGTDGTSISYKLNVANIENVTQAHIHMAPAGANGGIVAWLYPSAAPFQVTLIPGRTQGTLAEGVITDARVINALAGQGVAGLLEVIRAGNAYVNVHTLQFPPGEIRGQID